MEISRKSRIYSEEVLLLLLLLIVVAFRYYYNHHSNNHCRHLFSLTHILLIAVALIISFSITFQTSHTPSEHPAGEKEDTTAQRDSRHVPRHTRGLPG